MLKGLTIIFGFLLLGDIISVIFEIPIPGNVIGMILITIALQRGYIKLEDVKPTADVLIKNLALFFVPPGVGLMLYGGLLKEEFIAIGTSFVFSTFLVMAVVGYTQQKLEEKEDA